MINWFKRLFHFHEWEIIKEVERVELQQGKERVIGTNYYQKCKICSQLRKVRL